MLIFVQQAQPQSSLPNAPHVTEQDIERARAKHRMPTDEELARVPVPSTPRVDALPSPASSAPIDLAKIARGYTANPQAFGSALTSGDPGLLIFVSLSMPEPTLQRLVDQATRAKASLVIRGLANASLRQTVQQIQRLIGKRQVAFQIDPQAFDRYAVSRVPSFVLVHDQSPPVACTTGACGAQAGARAFVSAAGDVSLDYVLEHIEKTAPAFRSDATTFLRRIRS